MYRNSINKTNKIKSNIITTSDTMPKIKHSTVSSSSSASVSASNNLFKRLFSKKSKPKSHSTKTLDINHSNNHNSPDSYNPTNCLPRPNSAHSISNTNQISPPNDDNIKSLPLQSLVLSQPDIITTSPTSESHLSIIDNSNCSFTPSGDTNVHLNVPGVDRTRKSSDNDSAVDCNFQDDDVSSKGIKNKMSIGSDTAYNTNEDDTVVTSSTTLTVQPVTLATKTIERSESMSSWRKIKAALIWTPFIQYCAKHQYPWIQIAGHQGNFKPGEQGTILKKHCPRESICLQLMNEDILQEFVPQFVSEVDYEGEKYICMQDLLQQFDRPSLMDIKMGTRTYLEEELVKAKETPKPRPDMYEKMMAVDENEPTDQEHKDKAVLKPRYMIWRETLSSSVTLGFRVEGVKKVVGTQSRSFKKTKYRNEVKDVLKDYIDNNKEILNSFLNRLNELEIHLLKSQFFQTHEFIGSSLLFVYDKQQRSNIWMIDFGKTVPAPPSIKIDHVTEWKEGNHEDGYLFGLKQLVEVLKEIQMELL